MQQPFVDFFKTNKPKTILITSHENVDPDGLCSAFAIEFLIHTLYPDVNCVISFQGLNLLSQKIVKKFNLKIQKFRDSTIDGIIIVDTNSAEQLGRLKNQINWKNPVLVIDHHVSHPNTKKISDFVIINETAVATTEIIFQLYQSMNHPLSKEIGSLLFLGLLSDSRHLLLANNETLQFVHQILDLGVNYSEMIELLSMPIERPERIARLKAAQRATLHKINGWIVAISQVSAYEASACRALMQLGADVALVFGEKQGAIRVSARATNEITDKTKLNLANVMKKIGEHMHGEGGGHDRAAGCNGIDNLEGGKQLALKLLRDKLTNNS